MADQDHIGENLRAYLQAFFPEAREIFTSFEIDTPRHLRLRSVRADSCFCLSELLALSE